jgi:hypothetical protein
MIGLNRMQSRFPTTVVSRSIAALVIALIILCVASTSVSRTWRVPTEVPTLKAAVEDSAACGDTVLVATATYDTTSGETFPIIMQDGVVLASESGPGATVIDAGVTARVFDCVDLDSSTVIAGFTITGGSAVDGGGLHCLNSYLEIRDNIITGNTATGTTAHGGGIFCNGGTPRIVGNVIIGNKARKNMGGGIFCTAAAEALIEDNLIDGNTAKYGGGIFMQYCGPLVRNNTVSRNKSIATGAGVDCSFNSYPTVTGNVIVHNFANSDGSGIANCYGARPVISHNTIAGNTGVFGGGVRSLGNSSPAIWANIIVDNVDAIYLMADSDSIYAHANNIYYNPYQAGHYEVVNQTAYDIDLAGNYWAYTDSVLIASLISGPSHFMPFMGSAVDTVPGEPSAAASVTLMADGTYTSPLVGAVLIDDTLFVELVGSDWNGAFTEPALVILTSTKDPVGIAAALIETGPATGIYRGLAYVDSVSDDQVDKIGVNDGDEITVRANVDPSVFDIVTTGVAGVSVDRIDSGSDQLGPVLARNRPNPFRNETEIEYVVPSAGRACVEIYDVSGRHVKTLVNDQMVVGPHSVSWDGTDRNGEAIPSGIYFLRVAFEGTECSDKMILLR